MAIIIKLMTKCDSKCYFSHLVLAKGEMEGIRSLVETLYSEPSATSSTEPNETKLVALDLLHAKFLLRTVRGRRQHTTNVRCETVAD